MVSPLRRYKELYDRKGNMDVYATGSINYSDEELIDMSVLYLLSWCGVFTREEVSVADRLIQKGRHFSQTEKTGADHGSFGIHQGYSPSV